MSTYHNKDYPSNEVVVVCVPFLDEEKIRKERDRQKEKEEKQIIYKLPQRTLNRKEIYLIFIVPI